MSMVYIIGPMQIQGPKLCDLTRFSSTGRVEPHRLPDAGAGGVRVEVPLAREWLATGHRERDCISAGRDLTYGKPEAPGSLARAPGMNSGQDDEVRSSGGLDKPARCRTLSAVPHVVMAGQPGLQSASCRLGSSASPPESSRSAGADGSFLPPNSSSDSFASSTARRVRRGLSSVLLCVALLATGAAAQTVVPDDWPLKPSGLGADD